MLGLRAVPVYWPIGHTWLTRTAAPRGRRSRCRRRGLGSDPMTLHLHRAPRTDQLADALGELLATPLDDPFAEEVVVVPAKGVERWLTQRLSHRLGVGPRGGDGVCAGVRFLNPRLAGLAAARPRPRRPVGPRPPGLAAARDHRRQPRRAVVRHARAPPRPRARPATTRLLRRNRRYSVARRLAGLFASYAVQRPQPVTDWREGRDTDGAGGAARPTTCAGRPSCGAGCSPRVGATGARRAARRERSPRSRPAAPGSTCPPGCRSSATPGCRSPRSQLLGALGEHPRRPPLAAAALAGAVGRRSPASAAWSPATTTTRPTGSATRCWPRSAATPASCAAPWPSPVARRRRRRPATTAAPDHPARLAPARPARQPRPRRRRARAARVHDPDDRSLQVHACHGAGPPGRRAARGAGRAARGRPDPRAARHPRDVPRHRDLRAADLGRLRARRRRRRGARAAGTRPTGCGSGWPTGR